MKILDIRDNYDQVIKEAAGVIGAGGLVIYPTDTVYILAVDPTSKAAVKKLLDFKNRWTGKAISVAAANKKMAKKYVVLSETGENIYNSLLPGPFTIVSDGLHKMAAGIEAEDGSLGVRIPDKKEVMDLVAKVGRPVTATSANLSGRKAHYSVESFLNTLSQKKRLMIDLVVDGGKLPKNKPSTVIDARMPEIKVLRRGDLVSSGATQLISKSVKETGKIADFLWIKVNKYGSDKPIVFGLSGDLGTGKTVFSKEIGKQLGVKGIINSPTFTIFNEYTLNPSPDPPLDKGGRKTVCRFLHFDLYRLTGKREYEELGFLDLFTAKTVACIEWPENMGEELMKELKKKTRYIAVNFEYIDEKTRELNYKF